MPRLMITYDIAMVAGRDAANRNMRAHNRKKWNVQDSQVAIRETNRLLDAAKIPGTSPDNPLICTPKEATQ